jgi:hypothetical protein
MTPLIMKTSSTARQCGSSAISITGPKELRGIELMHIESHCAAIEYIERGTENGVCILDGDRELLYINELRPGYCQNSHHSMSRFDSTV